MVALSPALVMPSARTTFPRRLLKVPLGEEHQREVHAPNMFIPSAQTTFTFLPAREGAKMVRAEGITSAGAIWLRLL